MKMLAGILACVLLAGCSINEAMLKGHDLIDAGVHQVRVGLGEYHAEEATRASRVRAQLTAAFAKDVVAVARDKDKVAAKVALFVELLDKHAHDVEIERTRYERSIDNLAAILEVNASLRSLNEWKAGFSERAIAELRTLRGRLMDHERINP